jgi:hypothetical protein
MFLHEFSKFGKTNFFAEIVAGIINFDNDDSERTAMQRNTLCKIIISIEGGAVGQRAAAGSRGSGPPRSVRMTPLLISQKTKTKPTRFLLSQK